MAENTAEDDLELKPADAGAMFRVEMFTTNFLLGYWKHIVATVVVILVSILVFGQYQDYHRRTQRSTTAQIANALGELPDSLPQLSALIANGEAVDAAKLEATGDQIVAVADDASGTARVEGYLAAAEVFRLADKPDKQRAALNTAAEDGAGILGYAAQGGLATLELAEGQGDAAVERLRKLSQTQDGFLAEQAMIDLGLALEHLGKNADAATVYNDFLTRFPDSPRADEVKERQSRVAAGPGTPAAPAGDAPAPAGDAPAVDAAPEGGAG